ncbi:MAG: prolipoprotein diacylglyceryl transferase [Candidatus Delongbacteria bacterium]|nr:prolipoprotein diacylglyceryl transferase [Candidatus Delongbacteria bacterium]
MESFQSWWQTIPYRIDPTIFSVGSFQIKYYGLMYILAFSSVYLILGHRIKKEKLSYTKDIVENYIFIIIIFVLIGGRLGYVLFYNLNYFIQNPLEIFLPFRFKGGFKFTGIAGMSYHGATISAFIGTYYFTKKNKLNFFEFSDFVIPAVPLGYTFGRLGNFINGELYGRITDSWIGMYFPMAGDDTLRHPSQLYEAFFEGIFLFFVLWFLRKKEIVKGKLLALYLIFYGLIRFLIEFVREPDEQLGFVLFSFSMGQILCFIMVISGIVQIMINNLDKRKQIF